MAHEARREEVRAREEALRRQAVEAQERHREQGVEFDVALREAVSKGGQVPAPPPQPADGHTRALSLISAEVQAVQAEGQRVLADIAADVEAALADRVAVTMTEVAALAQKMERDRQSLLADLALARRVRVAADNSAGRVSRPSRADRTRSTLTFDDLVGLALHGGDPLEPEPMPAPGPGRILRDDGRDEASRIGMQPPHVLGYVEGGKFGAVEHRPRVANGGRHTGEI